MNILVFCLIIAVFSRGIFGNNKSCRTNTDCPSDRTCLKGDCQNPCLDICGTAALCVVIKHQAYCHCKDNTDNCLPSKVSYSCVPECGKNAICNANLGSCECKSGHEGNPYKSCLGKCKVNSECSSKESCISRVCQNPCEEDCGLNSLCTIENHVSVCTCPPGYSGDPEEICRILNDSQDICKICGVNAVCVTRDRTKSCMCRSGFLGNPYKSCRKMCLSNTDCPANEICMSHVCKNPCSDACGVNTNCHVEKYKRAPICSCKDGFSGDPSRICTIMLDSRFGGDSDEDLMKCHPECGDNAYCDTKHGNCVCNENFAGNPYGICRKKCRVNSECPMNLACSGSDCKNPCWTACGKNALCTVLNHEPVCRCPYGFSGDPFKICIKGNITMFSPGFFPISTQTPIKDVDLCDTLTCGINAKCRKDTESCVCLPGYTGDPYKNCFEICRVNSDCSFDKACVNNVCEKVCDGKKCGVNAVCKSKNHVANCACPSNYIGDPFKICFPDTNGVVENPSRVPCLKCICKALTGNDDIILCAKKSISSTYWAFAGEDVAGSEDFRTKNTTIDFVTCMNDRICILNTMNDYVSRVMHRLNDIDCDGKITCADYFAAHKFGLAAKFSDSIFNVSEARLFDQCEDHGEKSVSNDWKPKKCSGPTYVEILS